MRLTFSMKLPWMKRTVKADLPEQKAKKMVQDGQYHCYIYRTASSTVIEENDRRNENKKKTDNDKAKIEQPRHTPTNGI
jgi:hypothetical protein